MAPSARSLRPSEVAAVAGTLGRAFFDDPGARFVEPDPARRAATNGAFFAVVIRFGLALGDVVTTSDLAGVAVWMPPDFPAVSRADLERAGVQEAAAIAGPEATERMGVMVRHFESLHGRALDEPHWRLQLLGVEPGRQGEGIGSALLAPGHTRADLAGERCALETFTLLDVAFYERRGYGVAVSGDIPGTTLTVHSMVR
jgi:GNAT superfamily N-acetyltransferase